MRPPSTRPAPALAAARVDRVLYDAGGTSMMLSGAGGLSYGWPSNSMVCAARSVQLLTTSSVEPS